MVAAEPTLIINHLRNPMPLYIRAPKITTGSNARMILTTKAKPISYNINEQSHLFSTSPWRFGPHYHGHEISLGKQTGRWL